MTNVHVVTVDGGGVSLVEHEGAFNLTARNGDRSVTVEVPQNQLEEFAFNALRALGYDL